MMIAIVDYGVGNLLSVAKALEKVGSQSLVTSRAEDLAMADGVILPGVGAFGDAMVSLRRLELLGAIKNYARTGKPLLGICLGMQLLFSVSEEHGNHVGLGLIPGHVIRMRGNYKIPQVGWNQLEFRKQHPLAKNMQGGEYAYFVHSYYVVPVDSAVILATTDYYQPVPAIVVKDNIVGMQFHPEKSSTAGIKLLDNFVNWCTPGGVRE